MKYAAFITVLFVAAVTADPPPPPGPAVQGPPGQGPPNQGPPGHGPPGQDHPQPPPQSTAYETITTTALTTYCPLPTEIVHNEVTYTVTTATTLTITNCPCTIVRPVAPTPRTWYYTSCAEAPPTTTPCEETTKAEVVTPITYTTTPCTEQPTISGSGTIAPTTTASVPAQYTGAAEKRIVVGGMVFGIAGLVAGLVL